MKYRYEYRINKKGRECFRTESLEECKAKLEQLEAARPGVHTMQSRSCPCNKVGTMMTVGMNGKPMWGCWM